MGAIRFSRRQALRQGGTALAAGALATVGIANARAQDIEDEGSFAARKLLTADSIVCRRWIQCLGQSRVYTSPPASMLR